MDSLIVPLSWQQQSLLSPTTELEKALEHFEQLAQEQREAAMAKAKKLRDARRLKAIREQRKHSYAFGMGASWSLTDSEPMPSMFVALREVLAEVMKPQRHGRWR